MCKHNYDDDAITTTTTNHDDADDDDGNDDILSFLGRITRLQHRNCPTDVRNWTA